MVEGVFNHPARAENSLESLVCFSTRTTTRNKASRFFGSTSFYFEDRSEVLLFILIFLFDFFEQNY